MKDKSKTNKTVTQTDNKKHKMKLMAKCFRYKPNLRF